MEHAFLSTLGTGALVSSVPTGHVFRWLVKHMALPTSSLGIYEIRLSIPLSRELFLRVVLAFLPYELIWESCELGLAAYNFALRSGHRSECEAKSHQEQWIATAL
ncbi:hypothetical protein PVK06_026698 [Gossypium arboreum]|uniref:Uncharacterized protein n=1 Tax=Gossypium arboreum TaxID=29729 RepID=A0ABR0NYG3_GOSAR|nr:hypothetical protein PVK06_026698 [Gossypium arboreum]